jgi:hypothetical protein
MHNDDVAHEESEIDVRALVLAAVALATVVVGTAALMYALFWWVLTPMAAANDPHVSPLAIPETKMPTTTNTSPFFGGAPEPKLLTNEPALLKQTRQSETEELHTYGWVDEKAGIARVPIDKAKTLLLERGLPARTDKAVDPRLGTHEAAYGESSSGRVLTAPSAPRPPPPAAPPAAPSEQKSGE